MTIRSVESRCDNALPVIFDIFQTSFPLVEQIKISFFMEILAARERDEEPHYYFEVLEDDGQVGGFLLYEFGEEVSEIGNACYLWYIATAPQLRGKGIGGVLYRHVISEAEKRDCKCVLFEIEQPEEARDREGEEAETFALWRRSWYQKQGAQALEGVHYMCGVGWQPSIPMQIMAHPLAKLSAQDVLALAKTTLDEGITVTGTLELL